MLLVFDFLENLALLTLAGLGFYFVEAHWTRPWRARSRVLHGLIFGLTAFLVTATPLTLADGATIDARAGPMILAGIFGGPVGAVLAAALGALSRSMVGGSFSFSGVTVYFVYASIGLALAQFRLVDRERVSRLASIATLSGASFLGASAMFFLIMPMERATTWLQNDLPYILIANLMSVSYCAFVIGTALNFLRKNTEVLELNERLELAKLAGRFGVWDYDIPSDDLRWDARSAELHGLPNKPFLGGFADWRETVHEDDIARAEDAFQRALDNNRFFSSEYRVQMPDDATKTIRVDAVVLLNRDNEPVRVVGMNLDLTELRAAEANLIEAKSIAMQAQKFDTIGKMTGGVAHDFNNLLAVVMGNQELLRDVIANDPENTADMAELIEASLQATRRGADLTKNLLAYARQARLKPEQLDPNRVVSQTEAWLRRTIESSVEIECVLQAGVWPIIADQASLQSALVNLVLNARDSMDGSGKVTVETANVRIGSEYVDERNEDIDPGRYVLLAISDTGSGIPSEIVADIFDPFFTTKPVGKGTGLGLSMVHGFVKQSGGAIRVYTEPGVGASFKLYFPAVAPEAMSPHDNTTSDLYEVSSTNDERLLLVEDQEELLLVMERTLCNAGYTVVSAKTGDDALELFKRDSNFDLVATDIVMPGALQGPTLAKAIHRIDPGMRFIFFSGYAREAVLHGNGLRPDDISLMKPVSQRDLLLAVKSAIAGRKFTR